MKKVFLEKSIIIILSLIVIIMNVSNVYNTKMIAFLVLVVDFYSLIKYRDNPLLLFVFLSMMYFDYSVIISKYLSTTNNLIGAYSQIKYDSTMFIGISSLLLMHLFILLFLKEKSKLKNNKVFAGSINNYHILKGKKNTTLFFILILFIAFILFDYLFLGLLSIKRTIYEYMLILFIFGFYYLKNYKLFKIILILLMLISVFMNMKNGGRVVSLQPLIAFFFIQYYDKINYKNIFTIFIIGIIIFTIHGLYGDNLSSQNDKVDLSLENIKKTFIERKFALDTSISSYWTGLTFIETKNFIKQGDRLSNFVEYFTTYTLLGKISNYTQLSTISRRYYVHYEGGYINSYFYFWLGYPGIVIIGLLLSKLLDKIANVSMFSSDFSKMYSIYFISCMPRWYLYDPTGLFRGTLIMVVFFKILNVFIEKNKNENMCN